MSRHDPRKALTICLPDALRLRLVASTNAHLPLSYLTRQTLREALARKLPISTVVSPGSARPILLQLSTQERSGLEQRIEAADLPAETVVLSLLNAALPD